MINGEWISRRSYTEGLFKNLRKREDLISRQAAKEKLLSEGLITAAIYIDNLPTVEPRKGRDVSGEVAYYCDFKCSLCGADIGIVEGGVMDGGEFNYCPNCGARMMED